MKIVIVALALVALGSSSPVQRPKRSYGHYGGDSVLYSQPAVYSVPVSAPVYTAPSSTHVSSSTLYTVKVPVTYTYSYQQPAQHTVYESAPVVSTYGGSVYGGGGGSWGSIGSVGSVGDTWW